MDYIVETFHWHVSTITPMSKRHKMLASSVRDAIAPVLLRCPRECGIVSITEVELSPEFSYATIYVSALMEPDIALAFLQSQVPSLRKMLSSLALRRVPELRFRIDHRSEKGSRIDALLPDMEERGDN